LPLKEFAVLPKKAIALRDYYLQIAADKKEQLNKDPVQYTIRTDPEVKKLVNDVRKTFAILFAI
jgi:hypothetical protein